ncbi:hypothetical protein BDD12DRAFT_77101 [Trichophaea hybrida]|nr:hypothetical protein BDD12DRAFT_77101 [Trichophaea hybrida]
MASSRCALHQRSDSDTNVQASATVSQKPSDVSLFPSRSSTTSTRNSKQHKSQNSFHSSTTGTASRSNTVRSAASLDSLPPVPPLRIQKQRTSSFGLPREPDAATNDYALEGADVGGSYTNSEQPQNPRTPHSASPLPRSILKRPSKAALPPYTEDDYRYKSSAWTRNRALDLVPDRARMHEPTLRLVNPVEAGHSDQDGEQRINIVAESSTQGRLQVDTRMISRSHSTSDTSSPSSGRPITPLQPSTIPAWARYFYGKKGGRTSIIGPQTTGPTTEEIGIAVSSLEQRRPGTSRTMSISEIPRYFLRAQRPRDPDATTLWSLPHLDHTPGSRTETFDRQIVLFCLGFMLPLFWFIAAVLPLPQELPSWHGNLEAQGWNFAVPKKARQAEIAYERRYENARWWRRVNRIMSAIGVMIIGAAIALAVISSHVP